MKPGLYDTILTVAIENILAEKELMQPILVYHHVRPHSDEREVYKGLEVTPQVFTTQMEWLKNNDWQTVKLSEYVDALEGKGTIPKKSVVITFDDGNQNQYKH